MYLGHLDECWVKKDDRVVAGKTIIGRVGDSGANSPHLHLNVWLHPNSSQRQSIKHFLTASDK
ncbi:peptidoglycan DD-metalloendopeptidase family protein [bacterium]|nr:peptidoglycan DD-metalloendopeptidase family protein [bacterium]